MPEKEKEVTCFDSPPVTEMAIAVTFKPPAHLSAIHFGMFYNGISKEFPRIERHPYEMPMLEQFDSSVVGNPTQIVFQIGNDLVRYLLVSEDGTRVLQLQQDRFVSNWRRVGNKSDYPEFQKDLRANFEKRWNAFSDFIRVSALGELSIQQCDVTYVNLIRRGEGWETLGDLSKIFTLWSGTASDPGIPSLEGVGIQTGFLIPESKGRVRITVASSFPPAPFEAIQLAVAARVQPGSDRAEEVMEAIDLSHKWAVRAFTSVTSTEIQNLWKRKR